MQEDDHVDWRVGLYQALPSQVLVFPTSLVPLFLNYGDPMYFLLLQQLYITKH